MTKLSGEAAKFVNTTPSIMNKLIYYIENRNFTNTQESLSLEAQSGNPIPPIHVSVINSQTPSRTLETQDGFPAYISHELIKNIQLESFRFVISPQIPEAKYRPKYLKSKARQGP